MGKIAVNFAEAVNVGEYEYTFSPRLSMTTIPQLTVPKSVSALGYTIELTEWRKDLVNQKVIARIKITNINKPAPAGILPTPPETDVAPLLVIGGAILAVAGLTAIYLILDKIEKIVEDTVPVLGTGINFALIAVAILVFFFVVKQLRS